LIFFEIRVRYQNNGSKIIVSYSFKKGYRKDYDFISDSIKNIIRDYNQIEFQKKISLIKSVKKILRFITLIKKEKRVKTFSDKVRIVSLEIQLSELLEELNQFEFKEKLLISFCDFNFEENLLTQLFNLRGLKTATLQHGQYRKLKQGLETADVEAYLGFISDYIFTWGPKTTEEFVKAGISKERILEVGALKKFTDRKIFTNSCELKTFGIVLDGEIYSDSNIKMIQMANKISKEYLFRYYIRPHPMNKIKKYEKYVEKKYYSGIIRENSEYVKKVDFSLLHMTSVFVEMLSMNAPFFIFEDKKTEDIFKLKLVSFKNFKEFKDKYMYYRCNKKSFLKELDTYYTDFNCSKSIGELRQNYLKTIEKIIGDD